MATLTATAAASTGPVRAVHAGVNSITCNYTGTTAISPSATTILMCKIPNGATIIDSICNVSSGAATCPFDVGVQGDLSAIATGGTITTALVNNTGLPYDVSLSDDAVPLYTYVTVRVTPGTVTTEVEVKLSVLYTMDR